jgi:hypothetical protein
MKNKRRPNLAVGVLAGLAMAAITSLAAVVVYRVRGPAAFEAFGTTLTSAVALYFAAGIGGGAVVGLLLPLTAWRAGAALVGALAATPLYLGVAALMLPSDLWSGAIAATLVGGIVGYGLWSPVIDKNEAWTLTSGYISEIGLRNSKKWAAKRKSSRHLANWKTTTYV